MASLEKQFSDRMMSDIIHLIESHDNYGPNMRDAAESGRDLILNYHTHGPGHGYCVSICTRLVPTLPIMGQADALEELVHLRGMGHTEDQCLPLMTMLADSLQQHYGLSCPPVIYLNGRPLPKVS